MTNSYMRIVTLAFLAACSRGDRGKSDGPSVAAPPSAAANPGAGPPVPSAHAADSSACQLVTKSDAEAIFGEPLAELKVEMGMCEYIRAADKGAKFSTPLVALKRYANTSKASFESQCAATASALHLKQQPVAGLGDEAFQQGDTTLAVLKGDTAFAVTHWDPKLDSKKIQAFARKALERL